MSFALAARAGSFRGNTEGDSAVNPASSPTLQRRHEAARSEQVNDAGNKILDALRSNGYEPALRIEDVEIHGPE
jgi:hypothetical protein